MSDLLPYLPYIAGAVVPLTVLAYRLRRLRLIRHVYDKGGKDDAVAVIRAMKVFGADSPDAGAPQRRLLGPVVERDERAEVPRQLASGDAP